jgi:hypothetical protein
MAKLSTIDSARARIGFDDITTVNNAIAAALEAASVELSRLLRTPFDIATGVAEVFVPRFIPRYGRSTVLYLGLGAGFLSADPVVVYATTANMLSASAVAVDATNYKIDREKGLLTFNTSLCLKDRAIQVTYSSGFALGTGPTADVYQGVPDWLVAIGEEWAITVLDRTNPALRGDSAKSWEIVQGSLKDALSRKIRYFPYAEKPL